MAAGWERKRVAWLSLPGCKKELKRKTVGGKRRTAGFKGSSKESYRVKE